MVDFFVGCSGWGYNDWLGGIYPKSMEFKAFLPRYAKSFNFVEINSSFYKIPEDSLTKRWRYATPYNFRFTAKFPKSITHDNRLANFERNLHELYRAFQPLTEKLLAFIIQLPPSLSLDQVSFARLEKLLSALDMSYCRYAVELQHFSWFDKRVLDLLRKYGVCVVWNQLGGMRAPAIVTESPIANFIYIRFAGQPVLSAGTYAKVEEKSSWGEFADICYWLRQFDKVRDKVDFGIVAVENQYTGYAPATASNFAYYLWKAQKAWMKGDRIRKDMSQTSLVQFLGHQVADA